MTKTFDYAKFYKESDERINKRFDGLRKQGFNKYYKKSKYNLDNHYEDLKWAYRNGYFLRFLNPRFIAVDYYNIVFSNIYFEDKGFKGNLSRFAVYSGFKKIMCKLKGYKLC